MSDELDQSELSGHEASALSDLGMESAVPAGCEDRAVELLRAQGLVRRNRRSGMMVAGRLTLVAVALGAVFALGVEYGGRTRTRTVHVPVYIDGGTSPASVKKTAYHLDVDVDSFEPCCLSPRGSHARSCSRKGSLAYLDDRRP